MGAAQVLFFPLYFWLSLLGCVTHHKKLGSTIGREQMQARDTSDGSFSFSESIISQPSLFLMSGGGSVTQRVEMNDYRTL